jgi:hypothetical protein
VPSFFKAFLRNGMSRGLERGSAEKVGRAVVVAQEDQRPKKIWRQMMLKHSGHSQQNAGEEGATKSQWPKGQACTNLRPMTPRVVLPTTVKTSPWTCGPATVLDGMAACHENTTPPQPPRSVETLAACNMALGLQEAVAAA